MSTRGRACRGVAGIVENGEIKAAAFRWATAPGRGILTESMKRRFDAAEIAAIHGRQSRR
jgi:hypothetical protein